MLYVLVMDGYNQTSPSCKNGRPDDRPNTPRRCRGSASPTDSPPDCPSDGSAFYHDVIGVDFVAVDRLQSLLAILVEEVVFAELDDLVVHEVQQFGVALLHGGRDGVVVTKVGDADLEALVGLGPGEHLGVVGGEGVTTAVQQRVVGIGVLVVLLQLDVRRVLLEPGFGGGALSDDQGLAVELTDIGDLGALRGRPHQAPPSCTAWRSRPSPCAHR